MLRRSLRFRAASLARAALAARLAPRLSLRLLTRRPLRALAAAAARSAPPKRAQAPLPSFAHRLMRHLFLRAQASQRRPVHLLAQAPQAAFVDPTPPEAVLRFRDDRQSCARPAQPALDARSASAQAARSHQQRRWPRNPYVPQGPELRAGDAQQAPGHAVHQIKHNENTAHSGREGR
jgi:hypothetical protein